MVEKVAVVEDDAFERMIAKNADKDENVHRRPKKLTISQLPESLAPVHWSPSRPRPAVAPIWDDETAEELAKYIDWHHNHPHSLSPRPDKLNGAQGTGKVQKDPENPGKVYVPNGIKVAPLPPAFLPSDMGLECDIDEVSIIAMKVEYSELVYQSADVEDPWYVMSVKDHLEQSHIDGSHTTVKSKAMKKKKVSEFDKSVSLQMERYGDYQGGNPTVGGQDNDSLVNVALKDKELLFDTKKAAPVSPWSKGHQYSKFTKNGSALVAFQKAELEIKVDEAFKMYEDDLKGLKLKTKPSSKSRKSRKSKRNPESEEDVVIEKEDPLKIFKSKIGGDKEVDKLGVKWVNLARQVAKKAKIQKSVVNTSIDLAEACEKLRPMKVATLLITGKGNPNMLTSGDEPLFVHMFQKAIRIDSISGNLRPGDEANDNPDRVKIQRILDQLAQFGADINTLKGKEGLAPIHFAAATDNTKLLKWLVKYKAELSPFSVDKDPLTPIMFAAKFGNVHTIAELVRNGVLFDQVNEYGMTPLHYAGAFGQTRAALFLMRIGSNKRLQTKQGKTAGALAQEANFPATAQAISAYAIPDYKAGPQLAYIIEEEQKKADANNANKLGDAISFMSKKFAAGAKQARKMLEAIGQYIMKAVKVLLYRFAQIDIAEDDDEEEGDDADWEEKLKTLAEEAESKKEIDNAANTVKPFTLD